MKWDEKGKMSSEWFQEVTIHGAEEPIKPPSCGCIVETKTEPKFPHNYEAIIKDADCPVNRSSIEKLLEQLYSGVFLNQKRKKYWVQKNSGHNCFMLFARDLSITWGENKGYWHWPYSPDMSSWKL
uniref:Uncharacterized protein n=1 Tax=Nelumbo nucifera TaxID=4432 RepID=A0A822ZKB6_NELNU|nr:TPA_asm: hypothetical protein HUJ06_002115 [Nelumbo nucifera]